MLPYMRATHARLLPERQEKRNKLPERKSFARPRRSLNHTSDPPVLRRFAISDEPERM